MHKLLLILSFLLFSASSIPAGDRPALERESSECARIYERAGLNGLVDYEAFQQAYNGYRTIDHRSRNILTLIDFTKPSTSERLYVIDMDEQCVLYKSHVAHGKNSGENFATSFSNKNGSHMSSLGFYLTGQTYQGGNGYSLLLNGLEKGINDRARERAIVIHPAAYANPSVIGTAGRLGRSFGCPALPQALSKPIINAIRNGTILYIYAGSADYERRSSFLTTAAKLMSTGPDSL